MVDRSDSKIDSALSRFVLSSKTLKNIIDKTDIRLDTTFSNVQQITNNVLNVTQSLDSMMNKVQSGEGNLGKMIYDETLYNRLNRTTTQLDSLISDIRKRGMSVNVNLFGD